VDVRAAQSAWQVAGMGLSQAREGFSALPGVRSELQSIVRTSASPLGVLPGNIAIDENFGRAQFEAALRGQTNVVHVASHFDFRPGDEHRSMLLVGAGEPVSLAQLAVMNFARVEQLTLSACNTATGGGVNENGAEVEGLAAAVLKKRARSVLASLWAVADDSTAQLMQRFYAQRAQAQPTSRAQALRQAQLALLEGTAATATNTATSNQRQALRLGGVQGQALPVDPTKPFAHPYFWAPFVISGSWL
jgi:CHAT domain-containing protein